MKNKKVLIVDDNALNRKVFENIVGHSYLFDVAVNGLEAIEKIKNEHFDVILMDIQMPKLDGISTLKIIKEDNLTTSPIIAISAYSSQSDRDCFLATGFDEFMAKPVKPKDLLESIYHHLNKPTVLQEAKLNESPYSDFDETIIDKLRKYNSTENIQTVYLDFLEEAEGLIEEIKIFIQKKRFDEIGEKLHILKGNSGTLGAKQLFIFSATFEDKIKKSNFDSILEDYFTLEKHLHNFRNTLKEQKIF